MGQGRTEGETRDALVLTETIEGDCGGMVGTRSVGGREADCER